MASTGEAFGLFWDSENGDRTYSAASFEYWLKKFFTSGVFNGDLQVKATSGMTLEVEAGYTNADGKVKFWNAPFNVTLDAANSTYPRIDTVVIRRDNVNRQITCEKVTGAYSADTPQPTAPTRNSEIFELVIAQIYVGAGVTGVTQSNITDTRPNNELCGYITGTVEELDFSAFTAQFEAYFAEFKRNQMVDFQAWEVAQQAAYAAWFSLVQQQQVQDKADWDAWYAALQEELHELPEDTAEYLQIEIDEIRTSGTTGSILKITTTETSLEGKTVTVTNGTETRTATFDENLECLIAGYKGTGEVTISSSDGIETATTVVTIPYFGNYTYNIAFWAATVNIQGDDNLKGATITVKDSDDLTVGTVVLNVITGRGVFNASKADTYTFNYSYQGTDYSESLIVDEQITYSLSLSAGFDWRGWVDTARFLDSTDYNSLDEVLADEEAVRELCLEHNCVDYLADIATANENVETIINNDLFAKWVNNSDYALDFLHANEIIAGYMDTADKYFYGEWSLVGQVPTMTSNTTPYGEAICSNALSADHYAYRAFDNSDSTTWSTQTNVRTATVGYSFVEPTVINKVGIKRLAGGWTINTFKVQGSMDGTNYTDLTDVITATGTPGEMEYYDVDCDGIAYKYYVVSVLSTTGGEGTNINVVALQFYAWQPKGNVPVMTSNTAPYGECIGLSNEGKTDYYKSFDKDPSTFFYTYVSNPSNNEYVGYKFTNPIKIKSLSIKPRWINSHSMVKNFVVKGSNDKTNWVTLYSGTHQDSADAEFYDVNANDYYLYLGVFRDGVSYADASMQIAELQFYGRELSVSVPVMTGNTTPYGEVTASSYYSNYPAWKAFSNGGTYSSNYTADFGSGQWVQYTFPSKMVPKIMTFKNVTDGNYSRASSFKVLASNDNFVSENVEIASFTDLAAGVLHILSLDNSDEYKAIRVFATQANNTFNRGSFKAQYLQFYGEDYSEKEFEEGTTKKWLYDHGVELETLLLEGAASGVIKKEPNQITVSGNTNGVACGVYVANINFTPYNHAFALGGDTYVNHQYEEYVITNNFGQSSVASLRPITQPKAHLDTSAINQTYNFYYATCGAGGKCSLKEWWLE